MSIAALTFSLIQILACQSTSFAKGTNSDLAAVITASPPPMTGKATDLIAPEWQQATHISEFFDFTNRRTSVEPTNAYIVFSRDAVYCAFKLTQKRSPITANQRTNNVGLGLDDYVSLMFDTAGNGTSQYFFETTPAGVRYQAASESTRYDPVWTAQASIADDGWFAEFSVPYRFIRSTTSTWRLNFARYYAARQSFDTWSYNVAMTSPFDPTFWRSISSVPYVHITKEAATAEVYALATRGEDRKVFEGAAGQFASNTVRNVGLDVKVPITAGINFVGTLAPDFSNVENDQVTTSPQEFRYQYSEYRPFFTQGANFLPSSEVFYSPAIGIFDSGEKVEGTNGNISIGALNVSAFGSSDRAYSIAYNSSDQQVSASISGSQAQRFAGVDDVTEASFTDTNHASRLYFGATDAKESGSFTNDAAQSYRFGLYTGVNRPNYTLNATYFDVGPEYNPVDAYVAEPDIKGPSVSGSLTSTASTVDAIRQVSVSASGDRYVDRTGAARESDVDASTYITFKDLLSLSASTAQGTLRAYEDYFPIYSFGTTYRYDQTTASISYRSGTPDTGYLSFSWGPYAGFYLHQLNGSASYQISKRFSSEFDYSDVLEDTFFGASAGQTLRRLTLFGAFSANESLSLAVRNVEGFGGFALPGENLSLGYRRLFGRGDVLTVEYGSPASGRTLNRFIAKYVFLIGRGSGE